MAVDLTLKRLERLEKSQNETNVRLGNVEEALGRVVQVLEAHSQHFERMEDALIGISERMDRLTAAIARGRTKDLARLDDLDRRVHGLESRKRTRRK